VSPLPLSGAFRKGGMQWGPSQTELALGKSSGLAGRQVGAHSEHEKNIIDRWYCGSYGSWLDFFEKQ